MLAGLRPRATSSTGVGGGNGRPALCTMDGTRIRSLLIAGVTALLQEVLSKSPATTHVVIDEIDPDNWGVGGLPALEWRAKQNGGSGKS